MLERQKILLPGQEFTWFHLRKIIESAPFDFNRYEIPKKIIKFKKFVIANEKNNKERIPLDQLAYVFDFLFEKKDSVREKELKEKIHDFLNNGELIDFREINHLFKKLPDEENILLLIFIEYVKEKWFNPWVDNVFRKNYYPSHSVSYINFLPLPVKLFHSAEHGLLFDRFKYHNYTEQDIGSIYIDAFMHIFHSQLSMNQKSRIALNLGNFSLNEIQQLWEFITIPFNSNRSFNIYRLADAFHDFCCLPEKYRKLEILEDFSLSLQHNVFVRTPLILIRQLMEIILRNPCQGAILLKEIKNNPRQFSELFAAQDLKNIKLYTRIIVAPGLFSFLPYKIKEKISMEIPYYKEGVSGLLFKTPQENIETVIERIHKNFFKKTQSCSFL